MALRGDRITNRALSPRRDSQDFLTPHRSSQQLTGASAESRQTNYTRLPPSGGQRSTVQKLMDQQKELQKSSERIEKVLQELQEAAASQQASAEDRGFHKMKLPRELSVSCM